VKTSQTPWFFRLDLFFPAANIPEDQMECWSISIVPSTAGFDIFQAKAELERIWIELVICAGSNQWSLVIAHWRRYLHLS